MYAAIDLKLFTHVAGGADSLARLTNALAIPALQVERLVTAALAMGLLELEDDRLANAPDAARYLVEGEPGYAADWLTFTRNDVPAWFQLTEHLQRQEPPSVLGMYADLTVEQARKYHAATYAILARARGDGSRVVWICLGAASCWTLAAGRAPTASRRSKPIRICAPVVLDLPPVTEVTKEYIRKAGVELLVSVLPGDFTRTPFPMTWMSW